MSETASAAFFVPSGLQGTTGTGTRLEPARLETGKLEPADLEAILHHLRQAGAALQARRLDDIIAAIASAAARWREPAFPPRQLAEERLPALTGYSPPMIRLALDDTFASLAEDALRQRVTADFPDPGVLDGWRPAPGGGRVRACAPRLIFDLVAGNIPGLTVQEITRALLVKAPLLLKLPRGEPLLGPLFARTLAEVQPQLAEGLALLWWERRAAPLHRRAAQAAEVVVASGGDEALRAIRGHLPALVRFLPYGHRLSLALVHRERLTRETAAAIARDTALYDQQGCLSPHVVYVENGGRTTPAVFARWVADALERLQAALPRGRPDPRQALAIQQRRDLAALLGAQVLASEHGTAWTVILVSRPPQGPDASDFPVSCLGRTLTLQAVDDWREVAELVRPVSERLSALALAAPAQATGEMAQAFARLGVSRLCPVGQMQTPAPGWRHDGRPPLSDLVRWVGWEEDRGERGG